MSHRIRLTSKQVKALFAGTAVLAVATVTTLALWTVSSYLKATVTVSNLAGIEISPNGTTWTEPTTEGTASVSTATYGTATGLTPGDTAYIRVAIRAKSGTTTTVPIRVSAGIISGSSAGLFYSVHRATTATCTSTTVTDLDIVPASAAFPTALSTYTDGTPGTFTLAAGTASTAGAITNLCIKVYADTTVLGSSAPVLAWKFTTNWAAVPTATPAP